MRLAPWFAIGVDSWLLAAESSAVIALRLAKIARWDAEAALEAQRMVMEKATALADLQIMGATGNLGRTPQAAARKAVSHYRRAVSGNRRRLSGGR